MSGQTSPGSSEVFTIYEYPYPEEFFEDYLRPIASGAEQNLCCACPTCHSSVTSDTLLLRIEIDGCRHLVHKNCLIHWATRLHTPADTAGKCPVPACRQTLFEYLALPIKIVADKAGVEVEPEALHPPIQEFGRTFHTEEELYEYEIRLSRAIIEKKVVDHLEGRKKARIARCNWMEVWNAVLDKHARKALPMQTKYLRAIDEHELYEWRAALGKVMINQIKKHSPESVTSLELMGFEVFISDEDRKGQELRESWEAEKNLRREGIPNFD